METCSATTAKGTRCTKPRYESLDKCKGHAGIAKVGRKTDLTPELIAAFVELQSDGVLQKHAAQALSVGDSTVSHWLERGRADKEQGADSVFAQFVDETSRAKADGIIFHVRNLKKHAPNDWRSSSFFLERTDPDSYSRRDKTELTHAGRVEQVTIPDDRERAAEVAKILAESGALESQDETHASR